MVTRENIGTEILSGDAGSDFEGRPPFGIQQNLVLQPVRYVLLAGLRAAGVSQPSGELGLAAGNIDSSFKSGNVRFIHQHPKYTNALVRSTTALVRQDHKEACTVLEIATSDRSMNRRALKPQGKRSKERRAKVGRDGKTLGARLREAMAHEAGRRGAEYLPVDLLSDLNRLAGRSKDDPLITQQMLSAILTDKVTKTTITPYLAAACHVNPFWLGDGNGKMLDH